MRWILIVLLMCNGIFFLWHSYLQQNESWQGESGGKLAAQPGSSLQLLSELQEGELAERLIVARKETSQLVEVASPAVTANKQEQQEPEMCLLIGPFKEVISGKQLAGRLAELDITVELKSIEIPSKPDYWVHLPPQPSRRAAIKLLKELQAKKIDSFLITEGELENGISLGFFTEQARAEKVLGQRLTAGYQAEIKTVPRKYTEIWARLTAEDGSKLSDTQWNKISELDKSLERRKIYCDKIASADNFD